jgi:homoserine kinase
VATAELVATLRTAGIPAVISGAGPAVLALTVAGSTPGRGVVTAAAAETGVPWQVLPLAVDRAGAVLEGSAG